MVMVIAEYSLQAGVWLKLIGLVQRAVLHSSHELGELLQCFKHDDNTIKIILLLLLLLTC